MYLIYTCLYYTFVFRILQNDQKHTLDLIPPDKVTTLPELEVYRVHGNAEVMFDWLPGSCRAHKLLVLHRNSVLNI